MGHSGGYHPPFGPRSWNLYPYEVSGRQNRPVLAVRADGDGLQARVSTTLLQFDCSTCIRPARRIPIKNENYSSTALAMGSHILAIKRSITYIPWLSSSLQIVPTRAIDGFILEKT